MAILEAQTGFNELERSIVYDFDRMGVSGRDTARSMSVFEWLYEQHAPTAQGCAEVLPIASAAADVVESVVPGIKIDRAACAIVGLLHDSGKPDQGVDLLEKSERGESWDQADQSRMMGHPESGFIRLGKAGFTGRVTRPTAQHHDRQIYGSYGMNLNLDDVEQVTRDDAAVGDSVAAMFTRNNTRNAHLTSMSERAAAIRPNVELIYSHPVYKGKGPEITDLVLAQSVEIMRPIVQARLPHVVIDL